MNSTEQKPAAELSSLERHPKLTIFLVTIIGMLLIAGLAELSLRVFGKLNISYYTGYTTPGKHQYPYGEIPINSDGSPDEEFVADPSRKRVGYFGDSITYGVGAGYGFRIPDLLQEKFTGYQHWVFAQVGAVPTAAQVSKEVAKHQLASVIYLMNLNDTLPDEQSSSSLNAAQQELTNIATNQSVLSSIDSALRGKSYLYTYLRLGLKNALQRAGYEAHGQMAYELRPAQYRSVIDQTANRVVALVKTLEAQGVKVCVLLLPYEMQVSADAAQTYSKLGFSWEAGFLQGSTQEALKQTMQTNGVNIFDARAAFHGLQLKVGDAYVYDKGDKVDWNHPNRFGHKTIANWLAAQADFPAKCLSN